MGKVAIELHIGVHQFVNFGLCEKNLKVFKLLPLFITCLIFRTGVLLIISTHLNWWTTIPVSTALVMVMLLASQHGQQPVESLLAGLVNVFIISPGIKLADLDELHYREEVWKVSQMKKFYKKSSYFIFFFYTGLMGLFLTFYYLERNGRIWLEWLNMSYWGRKVFNESSFEKYGGLYLFSSIIIFTGFLNILIIHVDVGEELLDIDTPTPRSSFVISGRITPAENDDNISTIDDKGDISDSIEDEESVEIKTEISTVNASM